MKRYRDFIRKHQDRDKNSPSQRVKPSKTRMIFMASRVKQNRSLSKTEILMEKFRKNSKSKNYSFTRKYSDFKANKIQAQNIKNMKKCHHRQKSNIIEGAFSPARRKLHQKSQFKT